MALDHYVPQVHLRQFLSPALDGKQLHGIRKVDLLQFPCGTRDICRIEDGNTNTFLVEPRVAEDFLKEVEPRYNQALADLRAEQVSPETVFVISGFAAAITACAPASARISIPSIEKVLEATANVLDDHDALPRAPESLGGKTLSELVSEGVVKLDVDKKFPQAMGIAGLLQRTSGLGNADWEVLVNPFETSPYFTSDFPIAVYKVGGSFARLVPLSPDIAISIVADSAYRKITDLSFARNRARYRTASSDVVRKINQAIVRSAESAVFFRDNRPWVMPFVRKNARFRIEYVSSNLPTPGGIMTVGETRLVRW